jgi:hypothetical protein
MDLGITAIERSRITEIASLHNEIASCLRMSVEKAIRIGELLIEQKSGLQHGEFLSWVKANLPFTDRTAQRYMELYQHRDLLKSDTVSYLSSAYKLLAGNVQSEKPQDDHPKRLNPDDPDYYEQSRVKHRWVYHRIADLCCDLEVANLEGAMQIREELLELVQENGAALLDIEAHLGKLITELEAEIPKVKEAEKWALECIEVCQEPLPPELRAEAERARSVASELLEDCEHCLVLSRCCLGAKNGI